MSFQFLREGRTDSDILFVVGYVILARGIQHNACIYMINTPRKFDQVIDVLFFLNKYQFRTGEHSFRLFISASPFS